jgi:hypothetical protein
MRILIFALLMLLSISGSQAQNKKQLIEFLVHKNDSMQVMVDSQLKTIADNSKIIAEMQKQAEKLAAQADSLLKFKLTFNSQLEAKDLIIKEMAEKQIAMAMKVDTVLQIQTILKTDTVIKTDTILITDTLVRTDTIRLDPVTVIQTDTVLFLKLDAMQFRIDSLNFELVKKQNLLKITPPIVEIQGSFVEVGQGDCFHLIFKDVNGVSFDFGSANNSLPFDIYSLNTETDAFTLKDNVKEKTVTIVVALLKGVVCDGIDSYDEGKRRFELMPTIIDIRL